MAEHMDIEDIRPVAPLGLIVHDSCKELGYAVDKRLAEYRRHQNLKNRDSGVFFGYEKDSYIIDCEWPRFGTGEGKCVINQSVRGYDLFILCDCFNYGVDYEMFVGEGMFHCYPVFPLCREAKEGWDLMIRRMKEETR